MEFPPQEEMPIKLKIGSETNEWTSDIDAELPINNNDIPNFKEWVNFNGFNNLEHPGIDLAAYMNQNNDLVIGLPGGTPVRAVADGRIVQISNARNHYSSYVNLLHGDQVESVMSGYHHMVPNPDLKDNQEVKKGDVIGFLHQDEEGRPEGERLTHLHLGLANGWSMGDRQRNANPENVFPNFSKLQAKPFLSPEPEIITHNEDGTSQIVQTTGTILRKNIQFSEYQYNRVNNIK